MPDLPIFHNPSLAVALMNLTETNDDDDETRAAAAQRFDVRKALIEARGKHARATRIGYAAEDLQALKHRVTRAEQEADRLTARLRDQADQRLRRARVRRTEALQDFLARPVDVDPVSDRLDRDKRLRRLEGLESDARTLMLVDAAKQGQHPELLRAALLDESPPFATKTWAPLLPDEVAEELREWLIARRAPETLADVRAAWRLGRLADDLQVDRAGGQTAPAPRSLEDLNAIRVGIR